MASTTVSRVTNISSEYWRHDLVFGLQPIFHALRIIGIDLNVNPPRSVARRCAFVSWAMFLLVVFGCLSRDLITARVKILQNELTTESVYMLIYFGVLTVASILFILASLTASQLKWEQLWRQLREVEGLNRYTPHLYDRMRTSISISIIIVVLLSVAEIVAVFVHELPMVANGNLQPARPVLMSLVVFIPDFYEDFTLVCFTSLIWFASESIQAITEEVEPHTATTGDVSIDRIMKWKRNYLSVLELIEEIDGYFGPALLISFTTIFITTTIFCYRFLYVMFGGANKISIASLVRIMRNIVEMYGMIYGTVVIKNKALTLIKRLEKLNIADEMLRLEVGVLIIRFSGNTPRISPMGMFEVSPDLCSTLIGVTITNVLVMAQFQASK